MHRMWNYVLTLKLSPFWFALSCLLLLSLSLAIKSQTDSIVRVFDRMLEGSQT